VTNQEKYLRAFARGEMLRRVGGVYGRIIKTTRDEPTMLSEEKRKVVMFMGPHGLRELLGTSGYEALIKIGHTPDYVARNLARGMQFKLVLFDRPDTLRIATWKGAVDVVSQHYPELEPVLRAALPELKRKNLEDFEREAGYSFAHVQVNGQDDTRFMTAQRLLESNQTAADVRRFFFHTFNFSELYAGDGYTKTHDGKRGVREYLTANCPLASLHNCRIIDLNVEIPPE
jgi:hypothetical protein